MKGNTQERIWPKDQLKDEDTVRKVYGCPVCGERRVALLIRAEDGIVVDCGRCGCVYDPIEEASSEG